MRRVLLCYTTPHAIVAKAEDIAFVETREVRARHKAYLRMDYALHAHTIIGKRVYARHVLVQC